MRWLIVIFFASALAGGGLGNSGFAPIAVPIKNIYGLNNVIVTMMNLSYTILFIPTVFPANYLFDNYGMRVPIMIASVLMIGGSWLRQLVNVNFYLLFTGQAILAVGCSLIIAAPSKVAAMWFGDNERAIATMIGALGAPIGAAIGYILPVGFISDDDAPPIESKEHGRDTFFHYVFIQNIVIT